ncbi:hypothetical protein AALA79_06370 [Lachnospiraceae bacterium 64-25]
MSLVKQGQSIYQIYLNNKDERMCSEKLKTYADRQLEIRAERDVNFVVQNLNAACER